MQNQDDAYRKHDDPYDEVAIATGWQGPALVFRLASKSIEPGQTLISALGPALVRSASHRPDIGCTGWISAMICRKKSFAAGLVCHDLTTSPYPFDNESFNHVVSTGVFQFFSDLDRVFLEVHRILPGGSRFFFITGDRRPGEPCEVVVGLELTVISVPVTLFRHTKEQIEGWLAKNGFRLEDSAGFMVYMDRERSETFPVRAYLARKVDGGI